MKEIEGSVRVLGFEFLFYFVIVQLFYKIFGICVIQWDNLSIYYGLGLAVIMDCVFIYVLDDSSFSARVEYILGFGLATFFMFCVDILSLCVLESEMQRVQFNMVFGVMGLLMLFMLKVREVVSY